MRVVITGGTGLIGRALAADLAARGDEVTVLSRHPERAAGLPAGVQVQRWDAITAGGWRHLAEAADAIVNLAGENLSAGRWTAERKRLIRDSRVDAGRAVMDTMTPSRLLQRVRPIQSPAPTPAARKPVVLIQASAVGYYGPRGDEEITEEEPPGSDFLAQVCVEWEASTQALEARGWRRAVIRSGLVLSRAGGALPRLLTPFRLYVGGRLGSGRQWWPWIHIVDHVRAIRFLLDEEASRGYFNLVSPQPVTNATFTRLLARAMGRPAFLPAPALALRLFLGEMAMAVLEGQRVVPHRLLGLGFSFRYPNLEGALQDLVAKG